MNEYAKKDLTGTDFTNVDLSGKSLAHSTITGCKFGKCAGASFVMAHGTDVDFTGADITNTSFERADESVLKCLVGAAWNGQAITSVEIRSTDGFGVMITNAFVQVGCMQRTLADWVQIGQSEESLKVLLVEQPKLDLAEVWRWWQKYGKAIQGLEPWPPIRTKRRFCYFTGTNRPGDVAIINGLIKSARAAGVLEDFHVFAPYPVPDSIHHQCDQSRPWNMHMAKIDFLKELSDLDYDYFCWLDADSYFVRDPGDLSELIRQEPCWVSMESDLTSPFAKYQEWHGLFLKTLNQRPLPKDVLSPTIFEVYKQYGAHGPKYWNTNGGMWIVRKEAIEEFHRRTFEIFNALSQLGFQQIVDEPCLAIVGDAMVSDPALNTFRNHKHIWACDWHSTFTNRLPDGNPWPGRDWLTNSEIGPVNPAIVHCMRAKAALAAFGQDGLPQPVAEPVGTKLAEVIAECGIEKPAGCSCNLMMNQMNSWGIAGCNQNRKTIIHHLADASDGAGWLGMAKAVAKGYFSVGMMLDEAIKRAAA